MGGGPKRFDLSRRIAALWKDRGRKPICGFVFHKAWCEVNEEGTEAAAATVGGVSGAVMMNPPPPPPVFRADHPFIFLIRDTRSGALLFLGRVADPTR
jgi:serine protease inhibitor